MNNPEALTNRAYNFSVIFQDFCSKYKTFYESVELSILTNIFLTFLTLFFVLLSNISGYRLCTV